jgi:hypothetical protein
MRDVGCWMLDVQPTGRPERLCPFSSPYGRDAAGIRTVSDRHLCRGVIGRCVPWCDGTLCAVPLSWMIPAIRCGLPTPATTLELPTPAELLEFNHQLSLQELFVSLLPA